LQNYATTHVESTLPAFIHSDLNQDIRLKTLTASQDDLKREIDSLRKEDPRLFPVYADFAARLEPLLMEAKGMSYKIIQSHVNRRR
ncbi:hypothetical protein, partial [Salmonella sp. SAL4455]|uniref:hypothetical protein n=1 Tax=Salmonella sp. SAL4455 TaxID=3159910 RepID=UPI00397D17C8